MNNIFKVPPDWYQPYPEQLRALQALERGIRRFLIIWPRRTGKDVTSLMLSSKAAHEGMVPEGQFWYLFPEKDQGRRAIWEGKTLEGHRYRDVFAHPIRILDKEMKLYYKCPSGGESCFMIEDAKGDSLVGAGPNILVLSEFGVGDGSVMPYLQPILDAPKIHKTKVDNLIIINSTVRGRNHLFHLYNAVKDDPEWFVSYQTDETFLNWNHERLITEELIQRTVAQGGITEALANQEYRNHWDIASEGSYYGSEMSALAARGQLGLATWNPHLPVFTGWDLGYGDATAIWFAQKNINGGYNIIDFEIGTQKGLLEYIASLRKGERARYIYSYHFVPHDIKQHEWTSGDSRIQTAREHGVVMTAVQKYTVDSGIQTVRNLLPRCAFSPLCQVGLDAMRNYRRKPTKFIRFDGTPEFEDKPDHRGSDAPDAFRYLAIGIQDYIDGRESIRSDKLYVSR